MYLDRLSDQTSLSLSPSPDPAAVDVARHLRNLADRLEAEGSCETRSVPSHVNRARAERGDYLLKVRSVIKERFARREIFGDSLVDDPVWAMLLDLFEAHHSQKVRCVKSTCLASGVPATTAMRHLALMEELGLVERRPDRCDKRRTLLGLTDAALRKLHRYFDGF